MSDFDYKKISIDLLKPVDVAEVIENPFKGKKVVFTGDLESWDRPTAAFLLQKLGADINTSVSKRTNIVVVGYGAGPSKLSKIIELLADGVEIKLLNERLFNELTDPFKQLLSTD